MIRNAETFANAWSDMGKMLRYLQSFEKCIRKKTPQFFQIYSGKNSIANIFGAKTIGNLIIWYEKNNWPTCADMFVHISLN